MGYHFNGLKILRTKDMSNVGKAVGRITKEILGVKV